MKKLLLSILLCITFANQSQAIVTSTINKNILACNGSATTFQYTFPLIDTTYATDLQVSQFDNLGNQTILTTNYSVNTTTGTVTYPVSGTACPTGYTIVLLRVEPLTQGVAASYQGPGPTPPVMNMSDKLTMITQQLQEQANRTLALPLTSNSGATFPAASPGYLIGWNAGGALSNIANPSVVAQWTLNGSNIYYNLGNVSTTGTMTAAEFNGAINWSDIAPISTANINWDNINLMQSGGMNWTSLKQNVQTTGINWTSIPNYAGVNWAILTATPTGGTNWTDMAGQVPKAGLLGSTNIGGIQGAWATVSIGSIYQATTDGIVVAYCDPSGTSNLQGMTDSSSSPSTLRASIYAAASQGTYSITFPVRKNDYYEVTYGSTCSSSAEYFLPIGS